MYTDERPPQNVAHLFFGDAMMLLVLFSGCREDRSTGGEWQRNPWSFVLERLHYLGTVISARGIAVSTPPDQEQT